MKKVVLGFSGGVDSAVCAKLLKDSGFDVHGLYMDNTDERSLADAVNTARFIGIPLEVRDVHAQLEERVCSRFAESYLRGETPNPCIICNPTLKFKTLLDFANEIGADNIATGHYARAENGVLYKGMPSNDQSYMLCRIRREQLDRLTLPLGRFEKTQVRKMAEGFDLPVAHSQHRRARVGKRHHCFYNEKIYPCLVKTGGLLGVDIHKLLKRSLAERT